jgi:hypothetical protein
MRRFSDVRGLLFLVTLYKLQDSLNTESMETSTEPETIQEDKLC